MTRVAINGFGRIGRNFFRACLEREPGFELVAVNDLGDPRTMAHLLAFDSVLGPLPASVHVDGETLSVGDQTLRALSIPEPALLPWRELGIDVVVESTGRFEKREQAQAHLDAGAGRVLISAVANDADAYTPTQPVLDSPRRDLRRARAAAINLIPTSTGATRALGTVLPELDGKIGGIAVRAPVPVGSIVDLVVELARDVEAAEVNDAVRQAATEERLAGILRYAEDPLVSSDIVHSPYSCIFDSELTMANGRLVKVCGW